MNFYIAAALNLSIGVAAIIGWARFYRTDPAFLPFLLLITAGFLNEAYGITMLLSGAQDNAENFRLFRLFETYLLLWQFTRWGLLQKLRKRLVTATLFTSLWMCEQLLLQQASSYSSHFAIMQSLLIVILSIQQMNRVIWEENTPMLRQPVFIICTGLIIYFTYAVLTEMFILYGVTHTSDFSVNVHILMVIINFVVNCLFIWAIFHFPVRMQYFIRS